MLPCRIWIRSFLILSKISFLGGVSDDQREEIFRYLEVGLFKKGEYVSRKDEEPSHIYIIKQGKIELLITDEEVTVKKREFNVGDCFGEAAMLSMNNHTASFRAAEAWTRQVKAAVNRIPDGGDGRSGGVLGRSR
jgi:CRP-like cAMP-binding protein